MSFHRIIALGNRRWYTTCSADTSLELQQLGLQSFHLQQRNGLNSGHSSIKLLPAWAAQAEKEEATRGVPRSNFGIICGQHSKQMASWDVTLWLHLCRFQSLSVAGAGWGRSALHPTRLVYCLLTMSQAEQGNRENCTDSRSWSRMLAIAAIRFTSFGTGNSRFKWIYFFSSTPDSCFVLWVFISGVQYFVTRSPSVSFVSPNRFRTFPFPIF